MLKNFKFDDFMLRLVSAVVLLSIAICSLYLGNFVYSLFVLFLSIILFYETCKLLNPKITTRILSLQLIAVFFVLVVHLRNGAFDSSFLLFLPAILLIFTCGSNRLLSFCTGLLLLVSLMTFFELKLHFGTITLLWLVTCVIVTDLAGYFVGRIAGGPKVWPFISPNKTWSGLVGGWFFSLLFGSFFMIYFEASLFVLLLSLIVSISSQIGDFYESWLKRRIKKKDSSGLIPGHGGFMDRFDGFIGGAVGFKASLLFINPSLVMF